ncbi:hypothetical protein JOF55_004743 [Haloactinomyces albus]|uniref:Uncharacterized protein n=1 Tax=Haloactinomyces albus TaxID=1352928 RepID=A0AAE3ZKG3_9ACTN|nr:hypothetical protein [Haloactinomyces albus]
MNRRLEQQLFWRQIAEGLSSEDAAVAWCVDAGGDAVVP